MSENNVMQYFEDFGYDHMLFNEKNFSDNTISELLKSLNITDIDIFIKSWIVVNNKEHIYNVNNVSGNIELSEYGKAKDNDELPQINISLAYDQTDNVSLFYETYPGSIIDITECEKMVERASRYGINNVGFILDRGYFSKDNIKYFDLW